MSKRLTSAQLSAHPGYPSEWTLSRWRHENIGPPFVQIGGRFFYDLDEVEQWEQSNRGAGKSLMMPDPAHVIPAQSQKAELLSTAQLAERPGFPSEWTLSRWRRENVGPPFMQIGGRIFYDQDEAERWQQSNQHGAKEHKPEKKREQKPMGTIDQNDEGDAGQ